MAWALTYYLCLGSRRPLKCDTVKVPRFFMSICEGKKK